MIKINLEDTFDPVEVGENLSFMTFYTPLKNGQQTLLKIKIVPLNEPLFPCVYNLSFGPVNENEDINDKAKLTHANISKSFSTILLFGLSFLQTNPSVTVGVDGSDDARAYLYHRMFITNRHYLNDYFVAIGVDWYVKLLRNGEMETDGEGFAYFKPRPEPFDYQRIAIDLYRYYMFHLSQ